MTPAVYLNNNPETVPLIHSIMRLVCTSCSIFVQNRIRNKVKHAELRVGAIFISYFGLCGLDQRVYRERYTHVKDNIKSTIGCRIRARSVTNSDN